MQIQDVSIESGKLIRNERGFLREITRDDQTDFFAVGQLYQTGTFEGVVKAWYKHHVQYDGLFVLAGVMKLVLIDDRPDSPTYKTIQEIVVSATDPAVVRVPPGVWHGFQSVEGDLVLLHLNSHPIQLDKPDEDRLPFDTVLLPYTW